MASPPLSAEIAKTTTRPRATMATEIPEAITIPDRVETRLGTLTFFDGFPDEATVDKLYDNLDFQRGVQAVLTAMPAASQAAQRKGCLLYTSPSPRDS